jgi:hypothetical protein
VTLVAYIRNLDEAMKVYGTRKSINVEVNRIENDLNGIQIDISIFDS